MSTPNPISPPPTDLPSPPPRRGKVRDIYDLGDKILLVASDRISAFDWVLAADVPDKGRVLTQLSRFWFDRLADQTGINHHLITCDIDQMGLPEGANFARLAGRSMLCRKAKVIPFECVARGYLAGSGWKEYAASGQICGVSLPAGLCESEQLPEPIFTPATKAEHGEHDENVTFDRMAVDLGGELAAQLREFTILLYKTGAAFAATRGLLIADTKFEFGLTAEGKLLLIDEALTPDSSRFWPADAFKPGGPQMSFDKQYVRDWLLASDWDREGPPPKLPAEVIAATRAKYIDAYQRLTGKSFAW